MKFTLASVLIVTASAFSTPAFNAQSTALKMSAVETSLYTFEKSEAIFAEAKNVSLHVDVRAESCFISRCFDIHMMDYVSNIVNEAWMMRW